MTYLKCTDEYNIRALKHYLLRTDLDTRTRKAFNKKIKEMEARVEKENQK